ncbi:MAG: ATPase, T2SS/T4P/T4SS family [bacterium]|nr:ATPase, T2SS/T4P/T4SS family [bacterium]
MKAMSGRESSEMKKRSTDVQGEVLTIAEITALYNGNARSVAHRSEKIAPGAISAGSAADERYVTKSVQALTPSAEYIYREIRNLLAQDIGNNVRDEEQCELLLDSIAESEQLSRAERDSVISLLQRQLEKFSSLQPLVADERVNDIIVTAWNEVSVQIDRRNYRTDLAFIDRESYHAFLDRLLGEAGRSCTTAQPIADFAVTPVVRASVIHKSLTPFGLDNLLTLRVSRHQQASISALTGSGLAPTEILKYLVHAVADRSETVLIAGEVGTGKTTLVRAIATAINPEESLLVIEDTFELKLEHPFVRNIITREANSEGCGEMEPAVAIRAGMRMAMNRIILGEIRDARAAEAFVDVCASGHPGITTIHARSARDALNRLELFLSRAEKGTGAETIRRQIADAVSIVVYLQADKISGKRRITEVLTVGGAGEGTIQISPVYRLLPEQKTVAAATDIGPVWQAFVEPLEGFSAEASFTGLSWGVQDRMIGLDERISEERTYG